jgi:hypothetical protein
MERSFTLGNQIPDPLHRADADWLAGQRLSCQTSGVQRSPMNKARKIKEQIELLDQHLAAAKEYVARNENVRGTASWLQMGDWKGKSGHPLWMKNHMIPSTQRSRAEKVRALEKLDTKAKEKRLKERRRNDAHA